jgi:hypothetical protein
MMSEIKYTKFIELNAGHIIACEGLPRTLEGIELSRGEVYKRSFMTYLRIKWGELSKKYPDEGDEEILHRIVNVTEVICKINPDLKNKLWKELNMFGISISRAQGIKQKVVPCFNCAVKCVKRKDKINKKQKVLKKCAGCKAAWYCGAECQKADWGRHQLLCHTLQTFRNADAKAEGKLICQTCYVTVDKNCGFGEEHCSYECKFKCSFK